MRQADSLPVAELLDQLESFHGTQEADWPTDPYLFLVWWHCGYPASDDACAKGWDSLKGEIGVEPDQLLGAPSPSVGCAKTRRNGSRTEGDAAQRSCRSSEGSMGGRSAVGPCWTHRRGAQGT